MMTDQQLFDYLSGDLTADEISEVEKWIAADEKNKQYFGQFRKYKTEWRKEDEYDKRKNIVSSDTVL